VSGPRDRSAPARLLRARPRLVAALAATTVAGLLVTALLGGPITLDGSGGGADTPTPTITPVDVPDRTVAPATGLPPGVTDDGLASVDALTRAHVVAIRARPGMAMDATFAGPRFLTGFDTFRSGFDANDEVRIRIRVESDSRYRIYRRTRFPGGGLTEGTDATLERFADGTADYRAIGTADDRRYARRSLSAVRDGSAELVGWTRAVFPQYLNTTESTVERLADPERYRVVATGRPRGLNHDTRDYRAVAVVRPDGFVDSLAVRYDHPRTGTTVRVTVQYERSVTRVAPPAWYETARERTGRSSQDVEKPPSTRSPSPVM
jgi:hypothetical protein